MTRNACRVHQTSKRHVSAWQHLRGSDVPAASELSNLAKADSRMIGQATLRQDMHSACTKPHRARSCMAANGSHHIFLFCCAHSIGLVAGNWPVGPAWSALAFSSYRRRTCEFCQRRVVDYVIACWTNLFCAGNFKLFFTDLCVQSAFCSYLYT